ncbi:MAG: hypothetical protein AAF125_17480 [Chloroflexota bacterium]
MNNSGPNPSPAQPEADYTDYDDGRGVPWWALGCGVIAIVIVGLITAWVLPVIGGLIFLPAPPTPGDAREVSHERLAYGVDVWEFHSAIDICEVVTLYEAEGTCVLEAGHCDDSAPRSSLVGTCTGEIEFSRFATRWEAELHSYPSHNEIFLSRDTAWVR